MPTLHPLQIAKLTAATKQAAIGCSFIFSKWAKQKIEIRMDRLESVPFHEVVPQLGPIDPVSFGLCLRLSGDISGTLLFLLREEAGYALVDTLMNRDAGTTKTLGTMERSALLETGNIVGTSYVNALVNALGVTRIIPGPPALVHDLTQSIVNAAVMQQGEEQEEAMLAHLEFTSLDQILEWKFLFLPNYAELNSLLAA
jgi:chemotaxis protein CheC